MHADVTHSRQRLQCAAWLALLVSAAALVSCATHPQPAADTPNDAPTTPPAAQAASGADEAPPGSDQGQAANAATEAPSAAVVCRGVTDCDAKCDAGSLESCVRAAGIASEGAVLGMTLDESLRYAAERYQRACEGDRQEACVALGKMYEMGDGVEQDIGRALALLGGACKAGELAGCNTLGLLYRSTRAGAHRDPVESTRLFETSCSGGDVLGCRLLAQNLKAGIGVAADRERAVRLFRDACERDDDAPACWSVAEHLRKMGAPDHEQRPYYEAACRNGDGLACRRVDVCYEATECASLCEGEQHAHACLLAADWYLDGVGVTADVQRAGELYEKACALGEGDACFALGKYAVRYAATDDWPVEPERTPELMDAACDHGVRSGCVELADYLLHVTSDALEYGVALDVERGVSLLDTACRDGSWTACNHLVRVFTNGRSDALEPDPTRAQDYHELACAVSAFDDESCSEFWD